MPKQRGRAASGLTVAVGVDLACVSVPGCPADEGCCCWRELVEEEVEDEGVEAKEGVD